VSALTAVVLAYASVGIAIGGYLTSIVIRQKRLRERGAELPRRAN
jgi:hypothetical protein